MRLISATVNALTNFSYFFGHTVNKTISADVCYISKLRLYTLFGNIFPLEYLFSMAKAHRDISICSAFNEFRKGTLTKCTQYPLL